MEECHVIVNDLGTPQGGNISPLLANIYLSEFDRELETRGLKFCRYADDVVIFTRSEMAADYDTEIPVKIKKYIDDHQYVDIPRNWLTIDFSEVITYLNDMYKMIKDAYE